MSRKMHRCSVFYREFQGFADSLEPSDSPISKPQVKDLWILVKKCFEHLLCTN